MALNLVEFPDRSAASLAAAATCALALSEALSENGRASLMVSGGSTPTQMFENLSETELEWRGVTVGLVDERWVDPDDPDSNERLVRRHLLQGNASAAGFIPMWTPVESAEQAQASRDTAYGAHCKPVSAVVLGMGLDGHTASWFPGLPELESLASVDHVQSVVAVHAPGAIIQQRMTLTGAAIHGAKRGILLVFGAEKRSILLRSAATDPMRCPVRYAIDGLGDRLSIFWAP